GTEMQYQHLVFEEFARTLVPSVDEFLAPNGYDTTIDPSIFAEFAHAVFRLGHSMLPETIDRLDFDFNVVPDPNGPPGQQLGLIGAFLNPLEFVASGPTPDEATGAIVRGLTREVGNQIDEFGTDSVPNHLLGTPLAPAALNIARGRDTGLPSLNEARREFYNLTSQDNVAGDSSLLPYVSWADYAAHLKHPESLINFIAAYGTHPLVTAETTLEGKRAAAAAIVFGDPVTLSDRRGDAPPTDRLDVLDTTGDRRLGERQPCSYDKGLRRRHHHRPWFGRSMDRRPRRGDHAVRQHARPDLPVRVRDAAREPAERRPLLLSRPHRRNALRHRTGVGFVRQAGDGQHRRHPSPGADLHDPGLDARGRSDQATH